MLVLAFFFLEEYKAFALSGRIVHSWITQGVALGWELLPFQGVLYIAGLPRVLPWEVTEKGTRLKLHSLFLNFNSCPRSISSFKSGILFWTGI